MARHLTAGVVVLADEHPHAQGTIDAARAYARHPYAVGHESDARLHGFDEVIDPGREGPTLSATFKQAAKRHVPWVALRRDLAPPRQLLGEVLEATARRTSKEVPGFVVVLTGPEQRRIRRILTIVDRSDGQPSGLMLLAAVTAAEQTGAAVDVLVIGAGDEDLDSSLPHDQLLRVTRERDLFEQARTRSESLGARGSWMFIDHVEDRVGLVRDVLAADEYDLVVDDLGDVNLGGRTGRHKRIDKALRDGGPASITVEVLTSTDVSVLLVLDAIRLGLVPPKVKAGAGAGILVMGVLVSGAPKAAAGPAQREQAQTSISQTVDDYDAALSQAASMAAPDQVQASLDTAHQSGEQATAAVTGQAVATSTDTASTDSSATDTSATDADQSAEDLGSSTSETLSPADLAPQDISPDEAPDVDADSVSVPDDLAKTDVDQAQQAAEDSKDALEDAQSDFGDAQQAAVDAQTAAEDAAAEAVTASANLDQASTAYDQVTAQTEDVIDDATGVSGALPGGSTAEDLDAAQAQEAAAMDELSEAAQQADEAVAAYQDAATQATNASATLDQAAANVTDAQAQYNQDQATADAYADVYQQEMADARVSPVPEGEYTPSAEFGEPGPMWSKGYHTGKDYAAPIGTEVDAAGSGTVVEVKQDDPSYGNRIVIEHENGYYTTYNHLSQIDVTEGQQVTAGDKIGEVGDTGNVTGPHLHFEVTQGGDGWGSGDFVNPDAWLSGEVG